MLDAARVIQRTLNADKSHGWLAIDDVEVACRGLHGDPRLGRFTLAVSCPQQCRIGADALQVSRAECQQRGKDEGGRLTVGMPYLLGQREGCIPRPRGGRCLAEGPERIAQAAEADHLGIESVLDEVGAAVFRTITVHCDAEVAASSLEPALPEGGDAEHVLRFHQEHVIIVSLSTP